MDRHAEAHDAASAAKTPIWPRPRPSIGTDVVVTHMLIVRDVDRSRRFYTHALGAKSLMVGPPAILQFYNSWLILSQEGGPTDDKPDVVAMAPSDGRTLTSALNVRVADIYDVYARWRERGAEFLTPPQAHAAEIRCYVRDPDGHLIEVGQTTNRPGRD
jgi:lactoylglutathione lyase